MRLETDDNPVMQRVRAAAELSATYPENVRDFMNRFLVNGAFVERTKVTETWAYRTYQDLLLDVGVLRQAPYFVPDDPALACAEAHECYYNAYNACVELPGYTYVEGFARTSMLVVRHAWLEDPDGTIVDPTWANHVSGIDDTVPTYYGIRFDTEFVIERSCELGFHSILASEWRCKPDFPSLRLGFTTNDDGLVNGFKESA